MRRGLMGGGSGRTETKVKSEPETVTGSLWARGGGRGWEEVRASGFYEKMGSGAIS